jgi:hypothetical protein
VWEWAKANGGPLAFVVVGLGALAVSVYVGMALILIGVVGYIVTRKSVRDQLLWWLGGLPDRLPRSEDEMAAQLERWNEGLTNCLNRHGFLHHANPSRPAARPPEDQVARDCYYGERRTKLHHLLRHSDRKKWTSEAEWIEICGSPQTPDELWALSVFVRQRFIQPWRDRQVQP